MKSIIELSIRIMLLVVILFLVTREFKKADEIMVLSPAKAYYSKGSAPDSTRMEIIEQLRKFQDGYSRRDPKNIDTFMKSLYSRDNILILGTMPNEVYPGHENATHLVKSDWESWGDCRFDIDSANISSHGNTAWFSSKGFVEFDLSNLLVIPLRFTGIMVKEGQEWKFQQQQFQFDTDFSTCLIAILIISVWILISLITLYLKTVNLVRKNKENHLINVKDQPSTKK